MKKILALTLALAMSVGILSACSKPAEPAPAPAPAPGGATPAPAPAPEQKKITIKIGYENNPGEPVDLGCVEWARLAKEYSNGVINVEVFPSSQLGTKKDIIEQGMNGAGVVTLGDGSFYMDYVPDTGIIAAPYIFENDDQVLKFLDSAWWAEQVKLLEGKGLTVVADNWKYGERQTISKKPILTPDDFKGMKIRTPNNPLFTKAFELLGATPTPMPLGDVYPALQQGVVDGAENPLPVIFGSKQHEVAKNISLTSHIIMYTVWTGGTSYFKTIPAEMTEAFKKAGHEAGKFASAETEKQTKEVIAKFEAAGVKIHEVDMALFAEKVKPLYNQFDTWTPGLYDTVKAAMK